MSLSLLWSHWPSGPRNGHHFSWSARRNHCACPRATVLRRCSHSRRSFYPRLEAFLRPSSRRNDLHSYRRRYRGRASCLRTSHQCTLSLTSQSHFSSKCPIHGACHPATDPHTCFHSGNTGSRIHLFDCLSNLQYTLMHAATSHLWCFRPPVFASSIIQFEFQIPFSYLDPVDRSVSSILLSLIVAPIIFDSIL